jgi:hypothetical protein
MGRASAAAIARAENSNFLAASAKVQKIVAEDVAPLMARGMKKDAIAEQLGIEPFECERLMALAQNMWKTSAVELVSEWRGRVLTTYGEIMKELWLAYEDSKANNIVTTVTDGPDGRVTTTKRTPPDIRWLSALASVTKELAGITGLRTEAPVLQVQEVDPSVRHSLAPLDPSSYLEMIARSGGSLSVTVAPPPMASAHDTTAAPITVEPIDAVAN